ncbi:MAG: gliding motility-associated C-terminal domain-containing protein [Flavobacteriales bacterium]
MNALFLFSCSQIELRTSCCTNDYEITTENFKPDTNFSLYIPQAFTPNRDGMNDIFRPDGIGWNLDKMVIKNNGLVIHETSKDDSHENWWDGDNKPQGRYKYVMSFTTNEGQTFEATGHVCLLLTSRETSKYANQVICDCTTPDMIHARYGYIYQSAEACAD